MAKRHADICKVCCLLASIAFLTVTAKNEAKSKEDVKPDANGEACPNYDHRLDKKFLMLVSTLDGKISALNVEREGEIEWNLSTGKSPLLSSSISKLEVNRDGRRTRLIPSLDGGLYQYDGESIEPVPFNAETLLSSSFRFNDHSIMVGGKESETYGVDLNTGRVKYICDSEGCKKFESESGEEVPSTTSRTLVISRTTRTVRAADMITGTEKWNFSVGEHELLHITSAKKNMHDATAKIADEHSQEYIDDDHDTIDGCEETVYEQEESMFNFPWWNEMENMVDPDDLEFKIIVPKGLVVAVSKSEPNRVLWQFQFDHPIAKAWLLREGDLSELDLFDASHVPALSLPEDRVGDNEDAATSHDLYPPQAPAMYVGTHEHQFYVQASVNMLRAVENSIVKAVATHSTANMPTVTWKPYIASSPSRTPAELRNPLQITWENGNDDVEDTAIKLWCEYPYDVGYYLYPDTTPIALPYYNDSNQETESETLDEQVVNTLWNWKEVIALTILSTLVINHLLKRLVWRPLVGHLSPPNSPQNSESLPDIGASGEGSLTREMSEPKVITVEAPVPFASRLESDFELEECIGQGGFGRVIHVRNRIDDVHYAIKRIPLYNSEKAKERVSREVKALAKLSDPGIVRYHQAWFEYPPPGWQEARDKELFPVHRQDGDHMDASMISSIQEDLSVVNQHNVSLTVPESTTHQKRRRTTSNETPKLKRKNVNPLKPFDDLNLSSTDDPSFNSNTFGDDFSKSFNKNSNWKDQRKVGSTEPFDLTVYSSEDSSSNSIRFTLKSFDGEFNEEPDSLHSPNHGSALVKPGLLESESSDNDESSMGIVFSEDASESNNRARLPFKQYEEESLDIVFEHSTDKTNENSCGVEDTSDSMIDINCVSTNSAGTKSCNRSDTKTNNSVLFAKGLSSDTNELESIDSIKFEQKDSVLLVEPSSSHSTNDNMMGDNTKAGDNKDVIKTGKESDRNEPLTSHQNQSKQRIYFFIQMELCKKHSLKDWLFTPSLRDDDLALDIFWQIVSAVNYVHQQGLMHRDLKPSNILFSSDGAVKVGDFGLVTAVEDESALLGSSTSSLNGKRREHTSQVGTTLYMSPEQMNRKSYTHMVDIYAMGLILFELFNPPFDTQMERINTMQAVRRCQFPPQFVKDRPQQWELARAMLNPEPEERPSAAEILEHELLQVHERKQQEKRARSASRTRTISTCSTHSGQSTLSSSVPQ